jgi:DNA-binding response OmpR family regulator
VRSIKKNDEFKDIPVVFVSARKTGEDLSKGLARGGDRLLHQAGGHRPADGRIREILAAAQQP